MKIYYEPSLNANIIFREVLKELKPVKESLEGFVRNNYSKVLKKCFDVIEKRYKDVKKRELLKMHVKDFCSML